MFRRIFDASISISGVMPPPPPGAAGENIDGAKADPKSESTKKEKLPPPRTPEEKYTDLVKKYNDLVANYKACGVSGDELRERLTRVEEELVEENERFQETKYRLDKANEEIEVLTAFGPRRGEEGEEEEEEGGVSNDFISGLRNWPRSRSLFVIDFVKQKLQLRQSELLLVSSRSKVRVSVPILIGAAQRSGFRQRMILVLPRKTGLRRRSRRRRLSVLLMLTPDT